MKRLFCMLFVMICTVESYAECDLVEASRIAGNKEVSIDAIESFMELCPKESIENIHQYGLFIGRVVVRGELEYLGQAIEYNRYYIKKYKKTTVYPWIESLVLEVANEDNIERLQVILKDNDFVDDVCGIYKTGFVSEKRWNMLLKNFQSLVRGFGGGFNQCLVDISHITEFHEEI